MNYSKISVRYSRALYQAATEENISEKVMEDLNLIRKTFDDRELLNYVNSPVVRNSQKKNLVTDLFSDQLESITLNLLLILLDNNREGHIMDIARNYERIYKESRGIKTAEFTVASKADENSQQRFREILEKTFSSEIELTGKIKPDIIGGFILKVDDHQYDASVSTKLKNIKKKLLQTSIEKHS